ncbi:MAG: response regulator [Gemmatimonadota bacterium]
MPTRHPILLLVEDNPDHQLLITLALQDSTPEAKIRSVASGEMALQYLLGLPPFEDMEAFPRPSLVLLDLNLPGISGLDVLRAMRETRELREIPVLVLTVSDDERDRKAALELGAEACHQKPTDFALLTPIVGELLSGVD